MDLIGKKVVLRAMEIEDMKTYKEMMNDPEIEKMVNGWSLPVSNANQLEWFEKAVRDKNNIRFTIQTLMEKEVLGRASLVDLDFKNGSAYHGIKLKNSAPKKMGYGTDAVMMIMKYAFDELRLHRLDTAIIEYNDASKMLYKKCGWTNEGMKKEAIYKNGTYYNNLIYGILKNDYIATKKKLGY